MRFFVLSSFFSLALSLSLTLSVPVSSSLTSKTSASISSFCSVSSTLPLLNTLFSSLGSDCSSYLSLFSTDGVYYHQHDGFKTYAQLTDNCEKYGAFCPKGQCQFKQNGQAFVVDDQENERCLILAPYIWSESPVNHRIANNLEPHTGFEFIIATGNSSSAYNFDIRLFAEIESSFSVAFNWAHPSDPALYERTVNLLNGTASAGECDVPISPIVTDYLENKGTTAESGDDVWRQQGSAIVLAAGGLCHVAVPYASSVSNILSTGYIVFTLKPNASHNYTIVEALEFPLQL